VMDWSFVSVKLQQLGPQSRCAANRHRHTPVIKFVFTIHSEIDSGSVTDSEWAGWTVTASTSTSE